MPATDHSLGIGIVFKQQAPAEERWCTCSGTDVAIRTQVRLGDKPTMSPIGSHKRSNLGSALAKHKVFLLRVPDISCKL